MSSLSLLNNDHVQHDQTASTASQPQCPAQPCHYAHLPLLQRLLLCSQLALTRPWITRGSSSKPWTKHAAAAATAASRQVQRCYSHASRTRPRIPYCLNAAAAVAAAVLLLLLMGCVAAGATGKRVAC
jgi:hypothetical protein